MTEKKYEANDHDLALKNLDLMVTMNNISAELRAIYDALGELDAELIVSVPDYDKYLPFYEKANGLILEMMKKYNIKNRPL